MTRTYGGALIILTEAGSHVIVENGKIWLVSVGNHPVGRLTQYDNGRCLFVAYAASQYNRYEYGSIEDFIGSFQN